MWRMSRGLREMDNPLNGFAINVITCYSPIRASAPGLHYWALHQRVFRFRRSRALSSLQEVRRPQVGTQSR